LIYKHLLIININGDTIGALIYNNSRQKVRQFFEWRNKMSILNEGEMSTKELVYIWGSKKLKERYEKDNKISGKDKELLLKKAKNVCDIEDLGKGKFLVHKIYSMINPDYIPPLKKGLYNYLTPLILTKLLEEQDENYKITLPFLGWARKFEIVNDNYALIKYNQNHSSKKLNINEDIMFEYFERIDECLKNYINECLLMLANPKTLDLIEFNYVTMVRKSYKDTIYDENGEMNIVCKHEYSILSDDDYKFYIDCEQDAKIFAGINMPKEKFYGVKSYIYNNKLKSLLAQRNIDFKYNSYNIYCKNKQGIKDILERFEFNDNSNFVRDFNEKFIEYVNDRAESRQNKELQKQELKLQDENLNIFLQEHRLLETYLDEMNKLSRITLSSDYEDITEKLGIIETKESIANEFRINIIKK